jgi:hypothetical protein
LISRHTSGGANENPPERTDTHLQFVILELKACFSEHICRSTMGLELCAGTCEIGLQRNIRVVGAPGRANHAVDLAGVGGGSICWGDRAVTVHTEINAWITGVAFPQSPTPVRRGAGTGKLQLDIQIALHGLGPR